MAQPEMCRNVTRLHYGKVFFFSSIVRGGLQSLTP
jgi:hypothetical protein